MSLYTSLTGLNAATADLSVVSNNIANVGSTGFKGSTATFADVFASAAGEDPSKIAGIGTRLTGNRQSFTQGPLETTGNTLDMAITGDGFFLTRSAAGTLGLTRNGQFTLDPSRYLTTQDGARVMALPVDQNGTVTATGAAALQPVQIASTEGAPKSTGTISLALNLPASAGVPAAAFSANDPTSYNQSVSTTIYDAAGDPLDATVYYVRTSANAGTPPTSTWDAHLFVGTSELSTSAATPATPATLTFDANGNLTAGGSTAFQPFTPPAGGAPLTLTLAQAAGTTQVAQPFAVTTNAQDGFAAGRLTNIAVGASGLLQASYSNGDTVALGRLALGSVDDPAGLQQLGGAKWALTGAAGALTVAGAGDTGLGTVTSGSLERSNVDLSGELVNLIVAQRDFQANAKAIDTDGQMLTSILQLHS